MGDVKAPPGDGFRIRCPRLGHQIQFSYCRRENDGAPCFRTLDCWHGLFPVEDHLKGELTRGEWEALVSRKPVPKILSLLDLISQAESRTGKTGGD